MKCSEIKVVKKDGTKEEFNVQKVLAAVNKSAKPRDDQLLEGRE